MNDQGGGSLPPPSERAARAAPITRTTFADPRVKCREGRGAALSDVHGDSSIPTILPLPVLREANLNCTSSAIMQRQKTPLT